ncbi:hypothetical protein HID58_014246 [Brassica napus]|uniref:Pectate lyase n=1 Tax=Brassica napus TaxID=3708 RepID=A0ABQ8DGQ2_BRANA|nr:hypothetical protein HID58_014246 [Brassica napus]
MTTLPYADVDCNLRALAGRAEGFGRFAVGGLHGDLYVVTSLADDGPGSLREGGRRREPLWIVFAVSGTIHLNSYLSVSSHKTIDGRGQRIKLTGKGIRLKECEHIIICNLEFEGGRGHDVDGIQIKPKSRHIWIDRCYFGQHDKTMLIGADPSHVDDRCIRVTIHHCFFDGTRQRHPRLRFGKVHLYNNYTRNWGIYAVCASVEAQVFSQCNIYEAGVKKKTFEYYPEKAPDREEVRAGLVRSENDLFLNGAQASLLTGAGGECVFHPSEHYPTWTVEPPSDTLKQIIQICTGWQSLSSPSDHGVPK